MNILFAGRLVDFKDPVTFVKAAVMLSENSFEQRHQFTIAGDGELSEECRKIAGGHENISFLGWVQPEIVEDLMIRADIFCQLSPYENLWASTLMSAMKHKRAIICTDSGYTNTCLKHGYHAYLIPPKNHIALAEAIKVLAKNGEMRRMLGENAHAFVQENLSLDKIAGQIRHLLLQSLGAFNAKNQEENLSTA